MASLFPVQNTPSPITLTDASGSITTGGTAQNALAASTTRIGYRIQNLDLTNTLWINDTGGTAASFSPGSLGLVPGSGTGTLEAPGGFYEGIGTAAISIFSTKTGHKFTLSWW